jgi:hypothetical protein
VYLTGLEILRDERTILGSKRAPQLGPSQRFIKACLFAHCKAQPTQLGQWLRVSRIAPLTISDPHGIAGYEIGHELVSGLRGLHQAPLEESLSSGERRERLAQ